METIKDILGIILLIAIVLVVFAGVFAIVSRSLEQFGLTFRHLTGGLIIIAVIKMFL